MLREAAATPSCWRSRSRARSRARAGIWALDRDTDGIDGSAEAAGAIMTPSSLARAEAGGLLPRDLLDGHRSFQPFDTIDDLLWTGPTMINVNDFRAVLIA